MAPVIRSLAGQRARTARAWLAGAAALAVATGTTVAAPVASAALPRLHGAGFSTVEPPGWHAEVAHHRVKGTPAVNTDYSLSSKGSLNRWGIPDAGEFGVTIDVLPFTGLEPSIPGVAHLSLARVLDDIVAVPTSAQLVLVAAKRKSTTLDGVPAATISYAYYYAGRVSFQQDIVTRRHGAVVFVELDTDYDQMAAGQVEFDRIVSGWHWA